MEKQEYFLAKAGTKALIFPRLIPPLHPCTVRITQNITQHVCEHHNLVIVTKVD